MHSTPSVFGAPRVPRAKVKPAAKAEPATPKVKPTVKAEPAPTEPSAAAPRTREREADVNWEEFTPVCLVDGSRCLARLWRGGAGDQCRGKPELGADFCKKHKTLHSHGSVNGEIPAAKLLGSSEQSDSRLQKLNQKMKYHLHQLQASLQAAVANRLQHLKYIL